MIPSTSLPLSSSTFFISASIPSISSLIPFLKSLPFTVINVPPSVVPLLGDIVSILGKLSGTIYSNRPSQRASPVSGFVTATSFSPGVCAGVYTLIVPGSETSTYGAGSPPNVTLAPGTKFLPFMVTNVPP